MLTFVDFQPEHLMTMPVQTAQEHAASALRTQEWADTIKDLGPAWTAVAPDHRIVACAGVMSETLGVWAVLAPYAGRFMLSLVRRFKADIERLRLCGEVWMLVEQDFEQGERLARMLGMSMRTGVNNYNKFSVAQARHG